MRGGDDRQGAPGGLCAYGLGFVRPLSRRFPPFGQASLSAQLRRPRLRSATRALRRLQPCAASGHSATLATRRNDPFETIVIFWAIDGRRPVADISIRGESSRHRRETDRRRPLLHREFSGWASMMLVAVVVGMTRAEPNPAALSTARNSGLGRSRPPGVLTNISRSRR